MTQRAPDYRDRGPGFRKQSDVPADERRAAEEQIRARTALLRPSGEITAKPATARTNVHTPQTLEECEQDIQSSFERVAAAFAVIKAKRLYLETGCETFDAYCEARWNITRRRGYQLATAGETLKSLPTRVRTIVHSEAVAREVAAIPAERRVEILRTVAKAGPVTARAVREMARPPIDVQPEPSQPNLRMGGRIERSRSTDSSRRLRLFWRLRARLFLLSHRVPRTFLRYLSESATVGLYSGTLAEF